MTTSVESAVYTARVYRSRLSPEKIRARSFSRAPLGRRGVSEGEVSTFCGRVAEEISQWEAENAALRTENDRLKTALRQWQTEQATKRADENWQSRRPSGTGRGEAASRRAAATVQAAAQVQREAEAILRRASSDTEHPAGRDRRPYEAVLQEAQRRADQEAERVARSYRGRAGARYAAEFEELERRLAWATTFLGTIEAVEAQLRAARETLTYQVEHLTGLAGPRHREDGPGAR
jgi:cell division septum initiation protein DivIVA